jgi:hypothetical protein
MIIKQVRLAQTIPGSASNLLEADKYDLKFDGNKLHVKHLVGANAIKHGTFLIFPANIAYIEYVETTPASASEGGNGKTKQGTSQK